MQHKRSYAPAHRLPLHHFHPIAALWGVPQWLILLLAPFVRAIFLWQKEAFWVALWQNFALLCLLFGYAVFAFYHDGWCFLSSYFYLQRGIFLHRQQSITPAAIAQIYVTCTPLLWLLRARRVTLYYKTHPVPKQDAPITLLLTPRNATALLSVLLPQMPTATLPKQPLRHRSLFSFFWQSGSLFTLSLIALLLFLWQGDATFPQHFFLLTHTLRQPNVFSQPQMPVLHIAPSLWQYAATTVVLTGTSLFYLAKLILCIVGFCTEGVWQQGAYSLLRTQHGFTLQRCYFVKHLPPFCITQTLFSRCNGRGTICFYPANGKKHKIRSVLLKNILYLYTKD